MRTWRQILTVSWCGLVLLAAAPIVSAQTAAAPAAPPKLDSLRTPPSPAFAVLGIEPSAVERPTTPSDAAVTLVSSLRDAALPKNFAFETSPYWLVSQPHLTWRGDIRRTLAQSVARTSGLSIATAETGTTAAPVTSLAFGFRTLVASGHLSEETQQKLVALEARLGAQGALFLTLMNERGLQALDAALLDCVSPRAPAPTPSEAARTKCVEDYEARKQALRDLVLQSDAYKKAAAPLLGALNVVPRREGFFLEVAAAAAWDFPNASWSSQDFRTRALWVTPSYEANAWTLLGVVRYQDDARAADDDGLDWGGRAIYSAENYAFSLEYVERVPIDASAGLSRSHRLVGIGEYRVTSGTWVVASFGKDRQKTASTAAALVAQLGLAFSFSKERYKFE